MPPINSKTPASILQEVMIKRNELPNFDLIANEGPPHQMRFTYRVSAAGVCVEATARSKKDAKQEASRLCLEELQKLNIYIPEETSKASQVVYGSPIKIARQTEQLDYGATSPAVLLLELCAEFSMGEPVYELVSDTGPPHAREFEISVMVGSTVRSGVATTKKQARQIAAQKMYTFLRSNLESVIKEYSEDALEVLSKKASMKYAELKENMPWRPNLGQKIADYHLGLKQYLEKEGLVESIEKLQLDGKDPVEKVEEVLKEMKFDFEWTTLNTWTQDVVHVLHVPKSWPPLAWSDVGGDKSVVALKAIETLQTLSEMIKKCSDGKMTVA